MFLIAGASHCGSQAPGHRLMVVSQGLSCSHTWDLLEPDSSATLTSYIRTENEGYEGYVCYWCLAGKEGDPSQMVRPPQISSWDFHEASYKCLFQRGRSQDGGGVGRGEHFLPHKFIKRALKSRVNSTKQLLNAGRGHQAPRKATQLFERR